jgi:hypothetical protein
MELNHNRRSLRRSLRRSRRAMSLRRCCGSGDVVVAAVTLFLAWRSSDLPGVAPLWLASRGDVQL